MKTKSDLGLTRHINDDGVIAIINKMEGIIMRNWKRELEVKERRIAHWEKYGTVPTMDEVIASLKKEVWT